MTGPLPSFLFPAADSSGRRTLARLKAARAIRRIGPRLYTSLPAAKVADEIRRSWSTIVSTLFPGTLLSHRSAFEYRPDPQGDIFLTSTTNRTVAYPGLRLRFLRGPGPLADDPPFLTFRASSRPRAFLENLSLRGRSRKVVPIEELEKRLEKLLHEGGEPALNELRDRARVIARRFGWREAFDRLDRLIGALQGSRSGQAVTSDVARARVAGVPYDAACLERLQLLFGELRASALPNVTPTIDAARHFRNKAFVEAYFSNYIEGTTFELKEAESIVFDGKIPARRPKDAHDIVGTFRIVSDPEEMRRVPRSFEELSELLKARHAALMQARPEMDPGAFKVAPNRAGDTHFVHPEYVRGTLSRGMEFHADLAPGLPRAAFIMFLVADVHPFLDGNGRMARIMMNAELVAAGSSTIIIPTVYREDYLLALRALTRRNRPAPLVEMLRKAERFSNLDFSNYPRAIATLERRNWFKESDEAKIIV